MADGLNPVIDTKLGPAPLDATGAVGLMSDLAEMRNRQNANVLFQQQMSARHQLGEDLAVWGSQGLSPEEQITRASHQQYAPFVTPEIANFRQSNLAGAQVQQTEALINETKQRMYNAGLGPMAQALAAAQGDRAKLGSAFKIATAGLPPDLAKSLAPAYSAMLDSVTTGLPGDKDAAHAKVQENLRNIGMSFGGLPLDKIYAMGNGGVAPTLGEAPTATGAMQKGVFSGTSFTPATQAASPILGGGGAGPGTASPILAGGPKPQGTPASPGAPAPLPEPAKGPPNEASVVMGPSLASAEFMKKTGELGGAIQEEVNDNAKALPTMAKRVDLMIQALGQFQAGGFANTREGLAKLAQGLRNAGLDIPDDTIEKISNGSLPAQQVFQSLVSRAGVQTLKADAQGTGRVMRSEVDRYLEMMGDTQDPRALATIMSNLRYTLLVGYDQGQSFTNFKQLIGKKDPSVEGLDLADFPSWYNKNFDESKLVMPKGISLGGVSPIALKGGTGEATSGAKRPPIESFFK